MAAELAPPSWEAVGRLLSFAAYLYVLLAAMAASVSSLYRSPYLRRKLADQSAPLQQNISNMLSLTAVHEFVTKNAIYMAVFRMFVSTGICIAYVFTTYIGHIGRLHLVVFRLLGVLFALQLIVKMFMSPRPLSYVLHVETMLEAISLASLIRATSSDWLNFSFLQAYIVLSRYFQLGLALEILFMQKSSAVQRQLTQLTLEFIVFIYVFACGLMLFERMGDPWQTLTATTFELTLANSFYFTVVTIFTVGYGDFVPYTLMGRLWIIFIIVFGAYLVSRKIGQVIEVVSGMRRGLGSFVKGEGVDHCVICGNVKWEYLKSFVQEFYGDTRNQKKKLLVMCDQPNWTEETWNNFITAHADFRNNVVYLEGSCVSRDDLVRAHVDDALAVFVLNNQHNNDPYAEDSETLKRILTIRSYAPNLPIYSMCALRDSMLQITYALEHLDEIEAEESRSRRGSMTAGISNILHQDPRGSPTDLLANSAFNAERPQTHPSAYYSGDFSDDDDDDGMLVPNYDGSSDLKSEAICMQAVETSVLAENVFCNGLSTLLANLILRVNPQTKPTDPSWAVEYKIGTECRFEYVKLPMRLHGRKFAEIATIMYDFGVLLIATKRFFDKKWRPITPDTTIHISTIGLIITFHSIHFLDRIMQHIAGCVAELFEEEEGYETLSQDVPSVDDEFSDRGGASRYGLAGDRLTGDAPVAYDYSGDDFDNAVAPAEGLRRSWLDGPTPFDSAAPRESNQDDPKTEPKPPPEPSIVVSPLAKNQRGETSRPLIVTRTTIPGVTGSLSESDRESGSVGLGAKSDSTSTLSNLRSLHLGLSQESSGAQGSVNVTAENAAASDLAISSPHEESSTTVVSTGKSGISDLAEIPAKSSEPVPDADDADDPGSGTEETIASAMRSSFTQADGNSKRRGSRARTQRVSFPYQKSKVGGTATDKNGKPGKCSHGGKKVVLEKSGPMAADDNPFMFFGDDELPTQLKGHVLVCTIGNMAMQNLKHFLHRVWVPRGSSSSEVPVVAICPRLSEDEETELSGYASERLYIIQGNSLSVETLRRAQFDKAKAIIILACEDKNDVDHMDAKAIFTVMTLDYLLAERSETFVCSMLDAEESMQLLRAPAQARRRGTRLAREDSYFLDAGMQVNDGRRESGASRRNSTYTEALDVSRQSLGERSMSIGAHNSSADLPRSMSFVGIRSNTYTDRRAALEKKAGIWDQSFVGNTRLGSAVPFGSARTHLMSGDDDNLMNLPSLGGTSALNFLINPSTLTMGGGAALGLGKEGSRGRKHVGGFHGTRARDESFEKQRYASGEMMISSTYTSLLIREYAMPGLMDVVQKIFGAGMGKNVRSKRGWVRSVPVPQNWVLAGTNGRRIYREAFDALLGHGAVALGLYRSGDVPVRVQLQVDSDDGESSESLRSSSEDLLLSRDFGDESSATPHATEFSSQDVSESGSNILELGGDAMHQRRDSITFERGSILRNLPTYGAIQKDGSDSEPMHSGDEEVEEDVRSGERLNINIPGSMMFHMAEDMQAARQAQGEGDVQSYSCPSSRRTAMFKEVPGDENVLPYVYTNPEAYTLVSENDAVYVLVSPHATLPQQW